MFLKRKKAKTDFTLEERVIQQRFHWAVFWNYAGLKEEYFRLHKEFYGSHAASVVVNTDLAKEMHPAYRASPKARTKFSSCLYEPARKFSDKLCKEMIRARSIKRVILLAGGTASGKTTAVGLVSRRGQAELIVDGTLSSLNPAIQKIEMARRLKKEILVLYVFCSVETAMAGAIDRAEKLGRTLSIDVFAGTHYLSQSTFYQLYEKYNNDPLVDFQVVKRDESGKVNLAKDLLENKNQIAYSSREAVEKVALTAFEHECNQRKYKGRPVSPETAEAFMREGRAL